VLRRDVGQVVDFVNGAGIVWIDQSPLVICGRQAITVSVAAGERYGTMCPRVMSIDPTPLYSASGTGFGMLGSVRKVLHRPRRVGGSRYSGRTRHADQRGTLCAPSYSGT
jgi:hypothetical protein